MAKPVEQRHRVVIRFAGDSGDGMQLTGGRFASETALLGNDLSTLPDYPAEIRAPAGSLPGVSGFQIHFSDHDILTPGDAPDVLVAMNPAALKANVRSLPKGATIIVNTDAFNDRNLQKAGYEASPLEDGSLAEYRVQPVPLTSLTIEALKEFDVSKREAERSKNMFALGLMSWLYSRPTEGTIEFLERKFAKSPEIAAANVRAFRAGYAFGETTEEFAVQYEVRPAKLAPGTYRNVTGNQALAMGLVAASVQSRLPLFLGAYPITPASGILEELARYKHFGVRTFQAEDEIAAVGAALGASFGGSLGVSTSSGPGVVLKSETVGLAVTLELPLVILDIQRAGPSTGMPTKPEQADLLMVLFGRNAESPVPVVAASTPGHCFEAAIEAARIALKYRTPVYLLSDAYLANGSEPWLVPNVADLPDIAPVFATEPNDGDRYLPYVRDDRTLARDWAVPGTPGLEHRIGGLEKEDRTGNISYDPDNHDLMVRLRGAEGRRDRRRHPGARPSTTRRARTCSCSAGAGRAGRSRPASGRARAGREGRPRAPRLSEPVPAEPRRHPPLLRPRARPRDEPRPAPEADPRRVPRRRGRLPPRAGRAVHLGRARRRDRAHGMTELPVLERKDFKSDQEVRWCPGCGDYAILAAMQSFLPELGIPRERHVFISGIGCAARFPYYVNAYGLHSIHGRAAAIATGLAASRSDLSVWVVSGDGDALSIGGNHFLHALRRNVNITILLFNNQVYGLTKGQYSPTSPIGQVTGPTPMGSIDWPLNPVSVALGAEATFVARSIDTDRAHLTETLRAASGHRGAAFVEILQNCNVYNDGAFDHVRDEKENRIVLEHGAPIRFGAEGERGVRLGSGGDVELVDVGEVGEQALLVHDAHGEGVATAFALGRLGYPLPGPLPIGVFRDVERPVYDELMAAQLEEARAAKGEGDLDALLHAGDTWQIDTGRHEP